MRMMSFGAAAACAIAFTLPAQAQSWTPIVESRGLGRGAVICDNNGTDPSGNYLCLALRCQPNGPLEFAMIAEGGDFGDGSPMPVTVSVDGRNVGTLAMRPTKLTGQKHAAVPYDAAAHQGLIAALRSGSRASLTFFGTTIPLSLRGSGRQIDHAFAVCQAAAPQPAGVAAGGNLSAADLRGQLIGRQLVFHTGSGAELGFFFHPGQHTAPYDAVNESGRAEGGRYSIQSNGTLCWETQLGIAGCYRFYRADGELRVKRDDPQSQAVIGRVTVRN